MTEAAPPWPADLDALIAAPGQHRLLMENDRVRVLETQIAPGERTPLHTHRWPAVHYIVSWSDFVRRDANGVIVLDSRSLARKPANGEALWGEALGPHTLENVGPTPLRIISVEIKS